MRAENIELAVGRYFNYRTNIIVPNVSWGLGLHECDLLMLSGARFATEIEIKISLQDLKKDREKYHGHYSKKIKYLYFAIPSKLAKHIELIPERAGVLVVTSKRKVFCIKKPKRNMDARPFSEDEVYKLLHLGVMRTWRLRERLLNVEGEQYEDRTDI